MSDIEFEKEQLEAVKTAITAYRAAILAFATNQGLKSYNIDTGQTKQVVTRQDLDQMQATLDSLMNEYSVLCMRVNGGGVTTGRPSW